jgi:hypothetical protein
LSSDKHGGLVVPSSEEHQEDSQDDQDAPDPNRVLFKEVPESMERELGAGVLAHQLDCGVADISQSGTLEGSDVLGGIFVTNGFNYELVVVR